VRDALAGSPDAPAALGQALAARLLAAGGASLLEADERRGAAQGPVPAERDG
jgi:hypothetical protein